MKAWLKKSVLVAGLMALFVTIPSSSLAQPQEARFGSVLDLAVWHREIVDSGEQIGGDSSLALDSLGYPHISYLDGANKDIKYAWKDTTGWQVETVDSQGDVGYYSSMALDANGYPHLSYRDATDQLLKYAWKDAAGWHFDVVDRGATSTSSMTLDRQGRPHLSYFTLGDLDLTYAWKEATGWQTEIVDNPIGTSVGDYNSIAVDQDGYPHISYQDVSNDDLKYAWKDASGWHKELVDTRYDVGLFTSIALDQSGNPRISYQDNTNLDLKYAWRGATRWHLETVDTDGWSGWYTSLALDTDGYPYIGYWRRYSTTGGDGGKVAWKDAAGWHLETLDPNGGAPSLAMDSSGRLYASYGANGALWYAFRGPDTVTFSISGYVRDGSGSPIPDVTVSAGAAGPATTDVTGAYSITDLPEGTYTVTPSKSGWRFTPNSRTVSVPPNTSGQDFVGRPIEVVQEHAFDTCEAPAIAEMQEWWDHSPYRGVGIYIGGITRSCPQERLSAEWVSQVASQGWHFLPLWAGPQAPCLSDKHFSYDPNQARQEGIQEAERAIDAAYALGLVDRSGRGNIIYYDMESYYTEKTVKILDPETIQRCHRAVEAFVGGWVSEFHARELLAGVYGSSCGSNVSTWATLSDAPDILWIAAWNSRGYNPNVSVYSAPCLSNELWSNHQRIRQYAGNPDCTKSIYYVRYGNASLCIDSDKEDVLATTGAAVETNRADGVLASGTSTSRQLMLQDFALLTPTEGWALVNQRLYWISADSSPRWEDITPASGIREAIESAFFLDASTGWAVGSDGSQITVWKTTDRGQTWQSAPFLASKPDDFVAMSGTVYLDFIDPQRGWAIYGLPSSSNFDLGRLFKTTDGGMTWTELSTPLGSPVRFISPDVGWMAGGPARNELFVTRDGGQTWTRQEVAEGVTHGYLIYELPTFENTQDGIMPIVINDLSQTEVQFYITHDSGYSWERTSSVPLTRSIGPGNAFSISVIDTQHWVMADRSSLSNLPTNVTALDFVTQTTGWAYTREGTCSRGADKGTDCRFQGRLLRTADGGAHWSEIDLPYHNTLLPLILSDYIHGPELTNQAPDRPSRPSPPDGATAQSVNTRLRWSGGDPDGDTVSYIVYLELADSTPDLARCDGVTNTFCDPGTLINGRHYYWQVVATDVHGATREGPVWEFSTARPSIQTLYFRVRFDGRNDPQNEPQNVPIRVTVKTVTGDTVLFRSGWLSVTSTGTNNWGTASVDVSGAGLASGQSYRVVIRGAMHLSKQAILSLSDGLTIDYTDAAVNPDTVLWAGDVDQDNRVTNADLDIIASNMGSGSSEIDPLSEIYRSDLTGDGTINIFDLTVCTNNLGKVGD